LPGQNEDAKNLIWIAREQGMQAGSAYEPFHGLEWKAMLPCDRPVIVMGSIDTMKNAQRGNLDYLYGTYLADWCDWRLLRCSHYYAKWGGMMLSEKYGFYPLGELRRLNQELGWWYGRNGKLFIRPDANDKVFSGGVVSLGNVGGWLAQAGKDVEDTLLCVVAQPEEIFAEYRLVVADKKVVASSRYMLNDSVEWLEGCPFFARELAEAAAKKWSPHRIFVMDVAQKAKTGEYRILECGSIHTSCLYACELKPIVEAMSRIAEEEWEDEHEPKDA
jgi:hypothetical protein